MSRAPYHPLEQQSHQHPDAVEHELFQFSNSSIVRAEAMFALVVSLHFPPHNSVTEDHVVPTPSIHSVKGNSYG